MSQEPPPRVHRANRVAVIMFIAAILSAAGCVNNRVGVSLLQLRPGTDTDLQGSNPRSLLQAFLDPCNWRSDSLRARTRPSQPCQSTSYDSPALPRMPGQRIP